MKWQLQLMCLLFAVSCVGVDVESEAALAEEGRLTADPATWSFEGSMQGWKTAGSVFSANLSNVKPYAGAQSVALRFTGSSGKQGITVGRPPMATTVTFKLFVPTGAKVGFVQAFGLEDKTWKWTSTYVAGTALQQNAWNTLTLNLPPAAAAMSSIGIEFDTRSGWRGTMYLDSVTSTNGSAPVVVDAGTVTPPPPPPVVVDAGSVTPPPPPPTPTATGLRVQGNHIVKPDGTIWHGRGANLNDMRSCNACTASAPSVAEVKRRIDELVGTWKANFIRLDLESYASSDGYRNSSNYQSVLYDPQYLADVRELVRYIGTKPGVQVLVSLWNDPSIDSMGRPTLNATIGTDATWRKLAQALADQPHAMFGIINEPQSNFDGAADAQVHTLMTGVVRAIRETEEAANVPYHIVTVQGTGGWARRLDYYATHPITERGGQNIAYEIHVYDPVTSFNTLFERFASTLPIIIGEFGPMSGSMTQTDCTTLMDRAQALEIPHLAWTFHMRCAPSLVVDSSNNGCGLGMPLTPTAWGTQLKARLNTPW